MPDNSQDVRPKFKWDIIHTMLSAAFAAVAGMWIAYSSNHTKELDYRAQELRDEKTAHLRDNMEAKRDHDSLVNRINYKDSINAELVAGKYKFLLDQLSVSHRDGQIIIKQ